MIGKPPVLWGTVWTNQWPQFYCISIWVLEHSNASTQKEGIAQKGHAAERSLFLWILDDENDVRIQLGHFIALWMASMGHLLRSEELVRGHSGTSSQGLRRYALATGPSMMSMYPYQGGQTVTYIDTPVSMYRNVMSCMVMLLYIMLCYSLLCHIV